MQISIFDIFKLVIPKVDDQTKYPMLLLIVQKLFQFSYSFPEITYAHTKKNNLEKYELIGCFFFLL